MTYRLQLNGRIHGIFLEGCQTWHYRWAPACGCCHDWLDLVLLLGFLIANMVRS
jgi:hypothetical protein